MKYPTIEDAIGNTPLVALQRIGAADNAAARQRDPGQARRQQPGRLGEGPAGAVDDQAGRGARRNQARRHADRGHLGQHRHRAGDGGGHQGLPHGADHAGGPVDRARADHEGLRRRTDAHAQERRHGIRARPGRADADAQGKGRVLDQFANPDNPRIHYETTGPEMWAQTEGRITHFVSAMGTTGTITGVSRFLKEKNPAMQIIGAQPSEGSRIPGIRKWPQRIPAEDLRPAARSTRLVNVSQDDAEEMCRRLAREEGIFARHLGGGRAAGWRSRSRARSRTRPSCSWCATAATVTCRPACFPA